MQRNQWYTFCWMHLSLWWRRRCLVLKTAWQRSQTYPALSPACFPSRCNLMLYVLWVKCWHSLQQSLPSSVRSACSSTRSAYREISLKSGASIAKCAHFKILHVPDLTNSPDQQQERKIDLLSPIFSTFKRPFWQFYLYRGQYWNCGLNGSTAYLCYNWPPAYLIRSESPSQEI